MDRSIRKHANHTIKHELIDSMANSSIKMLRQISLFFMLLSCRMITPECIADSNSTDSSKSPTTNKEWGVYQIYWNPKQFEKELDFQLSQLGGKPNYVMFFRDLDSRRGFPQIPCSIAYSRKLVPVISLEIWNWSKYRQAGSLQAIVRGEYDNFFNQWAVNAAKLKRKVILRFGFEMNGDWFPWGQKPALFISAWRRVHRMFVVNRANNVQWMFSPNIMNGDNPMVNELNKYYPGDDFVDIIGVDGYNFGDHHDKWHHWQTYLEIFDNSIRLLAQFHKPLFISEIGCANGPRKAKWMKNFLNSISKDPRIDGFFYFNFDKSRENEPNWRLDSDQETLTTFKIWTSNQDILK